MEIGVICFFAGMSLGILLVIGPSYRNGVVDGYGYSKEPNCPGYANAGKYLRERMAHRWPELRVQSKYRRLTPYHEQWEDN